MIEQGYEVVCFSEFQIINYAKRLILMFYFTVADVGQEEDFEAAKEKAKKIGAVAVYVEDLRREFVENLCYPAVQCNAIYENVYLLGKLTLSSKSPIALLSGKIFDR